MRENKSFPKIRFSDFSESWTTDQLGNNVHFTKGKGISKAEIVISGTIGCIRYGELYTEYGQIITDIKSYTNIKNYLVLSSKNDVLIPASGETAIDIATASCIMKSGIAIGGDINILKSSLDGRFLAFMISGKLKHQIARKAQGISVIHLYSKHISEVRIKIPSLLEQQKIADFLSIVDQKIQALTRKKELLEQYKKGVMQKIFSDKGGQEPEIRFKKEDGSDYPEWEEKRFGEIYEFHRNNSLSREKLNYEDGKVFNIHYGDIHTKFKSGFKLLDEQVPFINHNINTAEIKESDLIKNGDLIIADASEDYADIGKTIEVISNANKKIVAGLHTFLARPGTQTMQLGFGVIFMNSWNVRYQIMQIAQGTKVMSISKGRINNLKLQIPCINEQKKIVGIITNLESKIHSVEHQNIRLKKWKKGLLQKMFI